MDASVVEFFAEKERISIIPNFKLSRISLFTGDLGPFIPGLPVNVPLWVAVNLKQRQKCRVIVPDWMTVEVLSAKKDEEIAQGTFSKPLSPYYMEIANSLLKYATDDIPKADEVRLLVKDVWDVRLSKLRMSIDQMFLRQETHAQVNNLTGMELNTVRPFLMQSLDCMYLMKERNASLFSTGA